MDATVHVLRAVEVVEGATWLETATDGEEGEFWAPDVAWVAIWGTVARGSPTNDDDGMATEPWGSGLVDVGWELRWGVFTSFDCEYRLFRGVTRWFEAGESMLVTIVDAVGNGDDGCPGDDSCDVTGCGGLDRLVRVLAGFV